MKYKSKVDAWLNILLFFLVAVLFFVIYLFAHSLAAAIVTSLLVAALFVWLLFGTYYLLTDSFLLVHHDFIGKIEINYSDILSVQKTNNPAKENGYGLSLKRLEIVYKNSGRDDSVLISPKNREQFMDELIRKNPSIQKL